MTPNTLLALGILALVLQQLAAIFDTAAQWSTLSADDRRGLAVKVAVIGLGVAGAELLRLNIIPAGTFDATVSPLVLTGLSGILAGFGYDVAVGAIKLGGNIGQAAGGMAQMVMAKGQLMVAQAEDSTRRAGQAQRPMMMPPIPHSATPSADDALIGLHG